MTHAPETGATN